MHDHLPRMVGAVRRTGHDGGVIAHARRSRRRAARPASRRAARDGSTGRRGSQPSRCRDHLALLHLAARRRTPPTAARRRGSNSGCSGVRMRRHCRPDQSKSAARVSPGARSLTSSSGGPGVHARLVAWRVANALPVGASVARPAFLCSKSAMDSSRLATLRPLDEAHHLHPFTDHTDLHRQGTHVIRQASGCFVTDETGRTARRPGRAVVRQRRLRPARDRRRGAPRR